MIRVIACITQDHNLWLLLLAATICATTSVSAFLLLDRARARDSGRNWSAAAGLVAGVGVWSTHFVAMTAYDVGAPLSFAPLPLFGSLVISIAAQLAAFLAAFYWQNLRGRLLAGAGAGAAVAAMHYTGMSGVEAPALFFWNGSFIAGSVLAGVAFSSVAFLAFFSVTHRWRAVQAGALFVIAICSLHFTGMAALTMAPMAGDIAAPGLSQSILGVVVGFAALLSVIAGLCAALADAYLLERRLREMRLREMVAERTAELRLLAEKQSELAERASAASAAKSQFLANMSHELRTPLNAIIGYGELILEDRADVNAECAPDVARMVAAGRHLLTIVNDILDVAKIDAGRVELDHASFKPADVAHEAIDAVRPGALREGTDLRVFLPPDFGFGVGDACRLKQCLLNLLSNAVKFSRGGKVILRGRRDIVGGAAWLEFEVTDTGIGMNDEEMSRLFQPFSQADASTTRKYGGTGLGLSITHRLAVLMGGSVSVQSAPGEGSRFTLRVPAYMPAPEQRQAS